MPKPEQAPSDAERPTLCVTTLFEQIERELQKSQERAAKEWQELQDELEMQGYESDAETVNTEKLDKIIDELTPFDEDGVVDVDSDQEEELPNTFPLVGFERKRQSQEDIARKRACIGNQSATENKEKPCLTKPIL